MPTKTPVRTRVRVNDTVEVLTGKDAGRRGTVIRVIPETNRVVVEQLNMVKRHTKPRPPANPQDLARQKPSGGVIDQESPLAVSNVGVVCPGCDKPTRIGTRVLDDGRKVRVCRHEGCRADIDR